MHVNNSIQLLLNQNKIDETIADAIFNGTNDGIIIIDKNYTVLFENKATKLVLGDNVGKKCFKEYQKRDKPCEICPASLSLSDGTVHKAEKVIQTPKGIMHVEIMSSPIKNRAGEVIASAEIIRDVSDRKKLETEKEELIIELQNALDKVKILSGFLPICASCKKIRDDKGFWNQVEDYIQAHSEAEFTHSICPKCAEKYYPDLKK